MESWLVCHWGAAASGQPLGRLSLGHRHVSLRRLLEVCPSWLQSAWFALGIWYIIYFFYASYLAVTFPVCGCCLWSTALDFSGDFSASRGRFSWFDSGYMFCISIGRLEELHTFSTLRQTFRLNGEECSVDASGCSFAPRSLHLDHWTIFSSFT